VLSPLSAAAASALTFSAAVMANIASVEDRCDVSEMSSHFLKGEFSFSCELCEDQ
jgi:hypothetical protein